MYDSRKYTFMVLSGYSVDEINDDLEGLYDYISTMKSNFELINNLDPVSYIKNYISRYENIKNNTIRQITFHFIIVF